MRIIILFKVFENFLNLMLVEINNFSYIRIQIADVEYRKGFEDELSAFKERIRRRAREKIEAAVAEVEEEEKKKRLGPGGLDPVEVFESLPQVIYGSLAWHVMCVTKFQNISRSSKIVLRSKTSSFFKKLLPAYQKKKLVIT